MAKKIHRQQATAEEHMEYVHEDHMKGTSQPVPETVTCEEFNQFTANLSKTLYLQQKKMEEMIQRLARHELVLHLKRAYPTMKPETLEDPIPLGSTVHRSTDWRIAPESITEREVNALLSLNKAALGRYAADTEPNDAEEGQRNL